jgi:hypothetical protein
MENLDALLALCLLKQPIAEFFRVFNNPAKILQWILLLISKLKEFSPCVYLHTESMPSLCLLSELTTDFFCALLAPTQFPPGRALHN